MKSRNVALAGLLAVVAGPASAAPPPPEGGAFALDLHQALRARGGNLAFSPASVELALSMAWAGARGATADEMAKVLRVSGPPDVALAAAKARLARLSDPARRDVTVRMANRLFLEKTYALEPAYVDRMAQFGAPLEPADFRRGAEAARQRINLWVAEETANRIANLLPGGSVNAETRLALVNAIYLLADWAAPFTKEATRPRPFHVAAGATKEVPTMHQVGPHLYAELDGVKVLEKAYVGGELAMTFVLPDALDGLPGLESRLDAATLSRWLAALAPARVNVILPKFTVDPPEPIALADTLQALGIVRAFDPARADFTAMAAPARPADRLAISRVFHKAFVKVDEKGTEAAAATAVLMQRVGSAPDPERPKEFKADHPFLFLIRDVKTGAILFMGRVADPLSS